MVSPKWSREILAMTLPDSLSDPTTFVRIAIAFYVLGLLLRDQLKLRLSLLAGGGFYLLYYLSAGDAPMWDAALGSLLMLCANLFGLCSLLLSRLSYSLTPEERAALSALGPVEPGQLRGLMRAGRIETLAAPATATRQGARPDRLWWVIDGAPRIEKDGAVFIGAPQAFVGEVSWMLGGPASATVTLPAGTRCVSWDRRALDRRLRRRPRLAEALHAMIGMDMARKVAASGGPGGAPVRVAEGGAGDGAEGSAWGLSPAAGRPGTGGVQAA